MIEVEVPNMEIFFAGLVGFLLVVLAFVIISLAKHKSRLNHTSTFLSLLVVLAGILSVPFLVEKEVTYKKAEMTHAVETKGWEAYSATYDDKKPFTKQELNTLVDEGSIIRDNTLFALGREVLYITEVGPDYQYAPITRDESESRDWILGVLATIGILFGAVALVFYLVENGLLDDLTPKAGNCFLIGLLVFIVAFAVPAWNQPKKTNGEKIVANIVGVDKFRISDINSVEIIKDFQIIPVTNKGYYVWSLKDKENDTSSDKTAKKDDK